MKLTTWNAEWLDTYWGVVSGKYAPGQKIFPHTAPTKAKAKAKLKAQAALIGRVAPDILFLCEAVEGVAEMAAFTAATLPDYDLVLRPQGEDYATGGRQWQWFLIRKPLADQITPELLPVTTWQAFAAAASNSIRPDGTWSVAIPRLRTFGDIEDVPVSERSPHNFYRHPQVLRFRFGGGLHEVIGLHLKSKHTSDAPRAIKPTEDFEEYAKMTKVRRYLANSHAARVKLSSEASNVRAYIDQRFEQEPDPSIIVVGDLNDGPGKELMEREYLLHDLISNLQGEVFFAQKFLNHALFDQPGNLRWTADFKDPLDPARDSKILLDHIMFTQGLTRSGTSPLWVQANAGRVEHLAYEETEAEFGKGMTSDHRPVSVILTPRLPS
ncbi:MAG: endonuclease/exonuclease/phosphatase family protein [Rhodobacteraceae bacterium]|nr:endonuclease/exonuclease/phosphatase family protein [Paracoccaceae bacterium]